MYQCEIISVSNVRLEMTMTDPDDYYPVNVLPMLAHAINLYFKAGRKFKEIGVVEFILPAGKHKEMMRTKGDHEIIISSSALVVLLIKNAVSTRVGFPPLTERRSNHFAGTS